MGVFHVGSGGQKCVACIGVFNNVIRIHLQAVECWGREMEYTQSAVSPVSFSTQAFFGFPIHPIFALTSHGTDDIISPIEIISPTS
jgi:hypothetical protein